MCVVSFSRGKFLGKIAVNIESSREQGAPPRQILARGKGWIAADVVCRAGPRDRSFEEQHRDIGIAIVVEGSFQYRSSSGRELMTPGSLLLGNAGQYFECGHQHGVGDRCISFTYSPEFFESLVEESNPQTRSRGFVRSNLPPVRELSRLIARATAVWAQATRTCPGFVDSDRWEEIAVEIAARALELGSGASPRRQSLPASEARITRVVRRIGAHPEWNHNLVSLAAEAKLSRYHFLRVFENLTGLTPGQFVLRTRLRNAATRLILDAERILNIAFDSGFGDVSNFNHAFRTEFGMSPRQYRIKYARPVC